jgi:hypothetical protein
VRYRVEDEANGVIVCGYVSDRSTLAGAASIGVVVGQPNILELPLPIAAEVAIVEIPSHG